MKDITRSKAVSALSGIVMAAAWSYGFVDFTGAIAGFLGITLAYGLSKTGGDGAE